MNIIRAMPCLVCIHYRTESGQDTEPNLKRLIQEIERKEFPFLMKIKLWHVFKRRLSFSEYHGNSYKKILIEYTWHWNSIQ